MSLRLHATEPATATDIAVLLLKSRRSAVAVANNDKLLPLQLMLKIKRLQLMPAALKAEAETAAALKLSLILKLKQLRLMHAALKAER